MLLTISMAGANHRIHDLATFHDWHQEHDRDNLEHNVDEREEKRDRANVIESFPGIGILERLARPDVPHDENPQDVHYDCQYRQCNDLN